MSKTTLKKDEYISLLQRKVISIQAKYVKLHEYIRATPTINETDSEETLQLLEQIDNCHKMIDSYKSRLDDSNVEIERLSKLANISLSVSQSKRTRSRSPSNK